MASRGVLADNRTVNKWMTSPQWHHRPPFHLISFILAKIRVWPFVLSIMSFSWILRGTLITGDLLDRTWIFVPRERVTEAPSDAWSSPARWKRHLVLEDEDFCQALCCLSVFVENRGSLPTSDPVNRIVRSEYSWLGPQLSQSSLASELKLSCVLLHLFLLVDRMDESMELSEASFETASDEETDAFIREIDEERTRTVESWSLNSEAGAQLKSTLRDSSKLWLEHRGFLKESSEHCRGKEKIPYHALRKL